jgi:hypothetical protein
MLSPNPLILDPTLCVGSHYRDALRRYQASRTDNPVGKHNFLHRQDCRRACQRLSCTSPLLPCRAAARPGLAFLRRAWERVIDILATTILAPAASGECNKPVTTAECRPASGVFAELLPSAAGHFALFLRLQHAMPRFPCDPRSPGYNGKWRFSPPFLGRQANLSPLLDRLMD